MRRILRPGGFVRVSTPDLRKYARGYLAPSDPFFSAHQEHLTVHFDAADVARPAFMVNQTFYSWGHKWMYDFEELRHAAVEAGFDAAQVEERAYRDSREPEVARLDIPQRENESIYVEMRKA
jgi:predicted SAM-dependent methyltransferase